MCWDVNFYKKQKVQKANSWYLSQICCKPTPSRQRFEFHFLQLFWHIWIQKAFLISCVHKAFCFTCQISSWAVWVHKHVDEQARPPEDCSSWSASCSGWGMRVSHLHLGNSTDLTNRALRPCLCQHLSPAAYLKNEGELFQWLGMCFKQREEKSNTSENKHVLPDSTLIWS